MISHTVKSKRDNYTYYYRNDDNYLSAIGSEHGELSMQMMQMAMTAYDHDNRQFVKERSCNVDVLNALLLIKRHVRDYGPLHSNLMAIVESHV